MGKILRILQKDIQIELRQRHAIASIFLFAVTCGYIVYRTFGLDISAQVWNIMLWILVLFSGINAVLKSFVQERKEVYLYYYTLFSAEDVLIAKLIYNTLFITILGSILYFIFIILLGNPIEDSSLFFTGSIAGVVGISAIFTFISSIAKSQNSGGPLMAILALPLVIPILMLLIRITSVSIGLMTDTEIYRDVIMIVGIDILMIGIMLIIFPTLWRS